MLHFITTFSRPENLNFYLNNLKDKNIIWHPIFHDDIKLQIQEWIKPYYIKNLPPLTICYPNVYKINKFIKEEKIIDNDWYGFLNDDDWFEDNILKIADMEGDVIFCSMKRGHTVPGKAEYQHGISTLIPFSGVNIGEIGLEQIFIKGYILKQLQFENEEVFDGLMAVELQRKYIIKYETELYAYFNYLQPGRWNIMNENVIKERFEKSKHEFRDISEHLDTLKQYADECETIVELGVNEGISTTAWALSLKENPVNRFVYCFDYIGPQEYLKPLLEMCKVNNLNLEFTLADDLKIEIPECDLLFCDTLHEGEQLRKELQLHANKVRKYIIFHDTESFRFHGVREGSEGLWPAVEDFLKENSDKWFLKEHYSNCNGLTILEKIESNTNIIKDAEVIFAKV